MRTRLTNYKCSRPLRVFDLQRLFNKSGFFFLPVEEFTIPTIATFKREFSTYTELIYSVIDLEDAQINISLPHVQNITLQ